MDSVQKENSGEGRLDIANDEVAEMTTEGAGSEGGYRLLPRRFKSVVTSKS